MDNINNLKQQKKDAESTLQGLVEQRDRLQKYKTAPADPPPPPDDFQKLDPISTVKQHRLRFYFQQFGVMGLWHAIFLNAEHAIREESMNQQNQNTVNSSWQTVIDDYDLGSKSRMLYYLASMPHDILLAIIEGNLPSKMQDNKFSSKYKSFLTPKTGQGVYICYVGVAHQDADSQSSDKPSETGQSLTLEELGKVYEVMERYRNNDDSTGKDDPAEARTIDRSYPARAVQESLQQYQDGFRRYRSGKSGRQFDRILNFLNAIELNYSLETKSIDSTINQRRLQRCFNYVGLSSNTPARVVEHHTHGGAESPVWGLFTAACRYLFKDRFSISEFSYQVIRTVRVKDIGLDEILVSILSSAYAFDGGLAAVHAGKQTGAKTIRAEEHLQLLKDNASFYKERGFQQKNINYSLEKYSLAQDFVKFREDDGKEYKQLLATLASLKSKNEEAIKYYTDLIAHLELQIVKTALAALTL